MIGAEVDLVSLRRLFFRTVLFGADGIRHAQQRGQLVPPPVPPRGSHAIALADTPGRRAVSSSRPMSGARPAPYGGLVRSCGSVVEFIYGPSVTRSRRRSAFVRIRGAFPFVGGSVATGPSVVYTHSCDRWGRSAMVSGRLKARIVGVLGSPATAIAASVGLTDPTKALGAWHG